MVREDWSAENPSPRADVVPVSEHADVRLKAAAGPVRGELDVSSEGTGRSNAAVAVAFLIVVATASLSAVALSIVCWLARAPSPLVAAAGLVSFLGVLVTGLLLAFRGVRPPGESAPGIARDDRPLVAPARAGRSGSGISGEGRVGPPIGR